MYALSPFPFPAGERAEIGSSQDHILESESGGSARGAGGPPLPCLLSNNCDEPRPAPLPSADRKRAESVQQNASHFVTLYGQENCGLFTVTFADDLTPQEAQRRVHNFWRRECSEMFGEFMRVREFTKRGRPHFHLLVQCHGDIGSGFNWGHYDVVQAHNRNREGVRPKGNLNRTPLLAELHKRLNKKGPLYGVGRMELTPIRNAAAVGFYVGGYLSKSIDHKPASAKGTRAITYSQGFERKVKGPWSWTTPGAWVFRAKLRTWAGKHGCESMKAVAALFGSRWAYSNRDAILSTPLDFYPTSAHAAADGIWTPAGSVNIRMQRVANPSHSAENFEEDGERGSDREREGFQLLEEPLTFAAGGFIGHGWRALKSSSDCQLRSAHSGVSRDSGQVKRGAPPQLRPPGEGPAEHPIGHAKRIYTLRNLHVEPMQKRLQL